MSTTPSTPDHRLRFPGPEIDFETDVGETGQAHDTYPAPGQQPRYDWMRMTLIGLLSSQSSYEEPTQYREGTLWFDLNELCMKVRKGDAWVGLASAIKVDVDSDSEPVTLQAAYATLRTLIGYKPTATFSGSSNNDGVTVIGIPESLRAAAGSGSRPFVWVDGVLLDPRLCEYAGGSTPVSVRLTGGLSVDDGQRFTVLMIAIDQAFFSSDEVAV